MESACQDDSKTQGWHFPVRACHKTPLSPCSFSACNIGKVTFFPVSVPVCCRKIRRRLLLLYNVSHSCLCKNVLCLLGFVIVCFALSFTYQRPLSYHATQVKWCLVKFLAKGKSNNKNIDCKLRPIWMGAFIPGWVHHIHVAVSPLDNTWFFFPEVKPPCRGCLVFSCIHYMQRCKQTFSPKNVNSVTLIFIRQYNFIFARMKFIFQVWWET